MADTAATTAAAETALDALRARTTIVADSGDFETIRAFEPTDATTNPSLVLQASRDPRYRHVVDEALAGPPVAGVTRAERVMTLFGRELTRVVPRYVSTEVDARLSFDTDATVAKARALIADYAALGVPADRILIKIASTWPGIEAARVLEAEGIACNMTLIFSLAQAQVCFDAGVTLISPFVGRITDWYKKAEGVESYAPADDPGVASVRAIDAYARSYGYPTQVMAASFRSRDQILALAGADLMTISPALLEELAGLESAAADGLIRRPTDVPLTRLNRAGFEWAMAADAMAGEKLAEGIRRFADDQGALEEGIAAV
ncbi:transaldolase family protein [Salinisphaera orenii]|uniref:transaldolase n=1 Tax=Salinisphaera orenii YIM 95161 TaxID=1051139 RepID=A0A423PE96_9GAMM|nr:transaldolase family protein [Salinisphaera halophila]ROO23907.1 transaldolase [Salinisphaera halophila YIM 95161]